MNRKITILMVLLSVFLIPNYIFAYDTGARHTAMSQRLFHSVVRGDIDMLASLRDSGADLNTTLLKAGYGDVRSKVAIITSETADRLMEEGDEEEVGSFTEGSMPRKVVTGSRTLVSPWSGNAITIYEYQNLMQWMTLPGFEEVMKAVIGRKKVAGLSGDEAFYLTASLAEIAQTDSDFENWPLMTWGVYFQNQDVIRVLLKSGAQVNASDLNGTTPLHWAAWNGNYEIVKMLLANGANPNIADRLGRYPYDWALETGQVDVMRMIPPPVKPLDTDGDGVYDNVDQCPNTPRGAKVDERGCWMAAYSNFFDTNKAVVKKRFYPHLKNVAAVLNNNPHISITLVGHTDSRASEEYNMELGMRRAEAVRDVLVGMGVDAARIKVDSKGESQPIASNATARGMAKNRRVEIMVWEPPKSTASN